MLPNWCTSWMINHFNGNLHLICYLCSVTKLRMLMSVTTSVCDLMSDPLMRACNKCFICLSNFPCLCYFTVKKVSVVPVYNLQTCCTEVLCCNQKDEVDHSFLFVSTLRYKYGVTCNYTASILNKWNIQIDKIYVSQPY